MGLELARRAGLQPQAIAVGGSPRIAEVASALGLPLLRIDRKLLAEDASTEDLKSATNDLLTSSQAIGQMIYQKASAEAQTPGDGGGENGADEVVEAEIVDESEEG